jgi:Tol biopolymer transport system component
LFLAVTLVLACQLTAGAQAPSKTGAKKTPVAEKTPTTAPKGSEKASAKETEAATPEAAAKVLDLRTIPLMEGAKVGSFRTLGMLMYEAKGTPKVAFNFQRVVLTKLGFKEQPGGYSDEKNVSGHFVKEGYHVAVSSSETGDPQKAGWSSVTLVNDGNIALEKLPVPPGVKPFYPQAYRAAYTIATKPAETTAACRKLLLAAGWEPYGNAGADMTYFKKNAIKLQLWISTPQGAEGKTLIQYDTELLQADLPAPPDAADPRYDDSQKYLSFESPAEQAGSILAFYQQRLGKQGWKPTTDKPIVDDKEGTQFLIFRNPQKDLLSLDLRTHKEKTNVSLRHQSAAEVAEEERLAKARAEQEKQKLAAMNKAIDVRVELPAGAKKLDKQEAYEFEFSLPTGSGRATLESFGKHFLKEGWTEEKGRDLGKTSGSMIFKKGHGKLTLSYFDLGIDDVDVKFSGSKNIVFEPVPSKEAVAADDPPADEPKPAKKPKKSGIPGLPPGVELPGEVEALLKKALEEAGEEKKGSAPAGDPKEKKKPKTETVPGLPDLPPGVELPDEVKKFLKKGLEDTEDDKPSSTKKTAPVKKPVPKKSEPAEEAKEAKETKETPRVAATRKPAPQEGASSKRKVTEKSLGHYDLSKFDPKKPTLWISPDGRRVAYLTEKGIVIDGEAKEYDYGVKPESFAFSPDSKRTAYTAHVKRPKSDTNYILVLDGVEAKQSYHGIRPGPVFSPDSKHVVFFGDRFTKKDYENFVVIDGKEGPPQKGFAWEMAFTSDSKKLVYGVNVEGRERAIMRVQTIDGSEEPVDSTFGPATLHHNFFYGPADQLGYIGYGGENQFLVVYDGKEDPNRFREILPRNVIVSGDGKHIAYVAESGVFKYTVVHDGKPGKEIDSNVADRSLALSPDGSRLGYATRDFGKFKAVIDGQESKVYRGVLGIVFSPDNKRAAYTAVAEKWVAVVDGKEGAGYDGLGTPAFSPDSKSVVIAAKLGNREFVLLDGQPQVGGIAQKGYEKTGAPRFGPDGQRLVYLAKSGGKWLLVDAGKEHQAYDAIEDDFYFSADGRQLATVVFEGDKEMVVVNGLEGNRYDTILTIAGGEIRFDESSGGPAFHYLAARGDELLLVEETIQE